jgi:hypothetical protein
MMAIGATVSGVGKADFAIAVDNRSLALVRAQDGYLYSVDLQAARAELIEHRDGPYKGKALNLDRTLAKSKASEQKY